MAESDFSAALIAPAKLNLGLTVLGKRQDGFHDLISLVAFADLHDSLFVAPAESSTDRLTITGPFAEGLDHDNLVLKAISAFRDAIRFVPPLSMTLQKNIPVAAGLGGGSADAAAILRLLARQSGLAAMDKSIQMIAAGLGADIPVCLESRCRYMHGTGTTLDSAETGFASYPVLLVNPGTAVPTAAVFRALAANGIAPGNAPSRRPLAEEIVSGRNDLEAPAISVAPEIGPVLGTLSNLPGSIGARLSGSGATCFALFETETERDRAMKQFQQAYPAYWIYSGKLMNWDTESLFPKTHTFSD